MGTLQRNADTLLPEANLKFIRVRCATSGRKLRGLAGHNRLRDRLPATCECMHPPFPTAHERESHALRDAAA